MLRAGGGAHFHLPIITDLTWPYISNYIPDDSRLALVCNETKHSLNERVEAHALRKILLEQQERFESNDDDIEFEEDDQGALRKCDDSYNDPSVRKFERISLPTLPLYNFDIGDATHVTCVVGGHTAGASMFAKKLLFERGGEEVYLERATGVTSALTINTLGSLLLFETHKQLSAKGLLKSFREQESDQDHA